MATRSGPESVLDRRDQDQCEIHVVRDRITRRRSPARSPKRQSYTSDTDEDETINPRVPQPYRTSFSAVLAPTRSKSERSRSTSPCSSLKGGRSRSKSPGRRSIPKHVRYDDKVVIRESGTSDSIYTHLSDRDMNDSSGHYSTNSSFSEDISASFDSSLDQERDVSSELRELSQQIIKEYSTPKQEPEFPRHHQATVVQKPCTPNGSTRSEGQNGRPFDRRPSPKLNVSSDYLHDRSVSYRVAISSHYSDEVKKQADSLVKERPPSVTNDVRPTDRDSASVDRRSSLPVDGPEDSGKLTPAKRSVSNSISNFFRRVSPHLGRKSRKGNLSNASSQSLTNSDAVSDSFDHNGSNLKRGKFRSSLLRLIGKSDSKKKGSKKRDSSPAPSFEDTSRSTPSATESERTKQIPPSANRYLKSIEHNTKSDKEVYQKFKERQTPSTSGEVTASVKSQAVKPIQHVTSPASEQTAVPTQSENEHVKAEPPNSLDVRMVPKSVKSLQASTISTISGDESIGECSLDANYTGSEHSLLSQSTASKQVVLSQDSKDGISGGRNLTQLTSSPSGANSSTDDVDFRAPSWDSPHHRDVNRYPVSPKSADTAESVTPKEFNTTRIYTPKLADPSEIVLPESSNRTPSYLRISSALSGYGNYSKYSAYRGIEKRSPYSSTLSLRSSKSDLATPFSPEMPIGKLPDPAMTRHHYMYPNAPFNGSINGTCNGTYRTGSNCVVNGSAEGQVNGENGHTPYIPLPTGDCVKDGASFIEMTRREENRLLTLCSRCERELLSDSLPEEASGKLRAAIGKANLLVSQKFQQFKDLCHSHMHPDIDGKPTKWEDLQGFWEMIKIQIDDVDEMFTEIDLMKQNGWREVVIKSRRSSSSSSPKSGSLSVSNTSTPSHTPGSKRKGIKVQKDTPESSPERTQKAKQAAKAREEARKKMLAQKRAAMKQQAQQGNKDVEIFLPESGKNHSNESSGTEV